jgi:hypothetical protein
MAAVFDRPPIVDPLPVSSSSVRAAAWLKTRGMVLWGYLVAVFSPPVGAVIGIVLIKRGGWSKRHGARIVALAVACAALILVGALSGPATTTHATAAPQTTIEPVSPETVEQTLREAERDTGPSS